MGDGDLIAALARRAEGYRDRVPVFRIEQPNTEKLLRQARTVVNLLWPQFGDCSLRPEVVGAIMTMMHLPDEGHVDVFHPSGAIAGRMRTRTSRVPIATDERSADRKALISKTERIAADIAKQYVRGGEELRFESLWEVKGQGVTLKGEKTPVALFEFVGAFRRYLHGLPVWGRASVHVGIGGGSELTQWGVDWRHVRPEPFAHTPVVSPEEGAKRVMGDMWWRRPERPFTLDDFEPKSFSLGYVSLPRRREQGVMQPAWVAVLRPRKPMSMGHIVIVPAAPHAFEPLDRPARTPTVAGRTTVMQAAGSGTAKGSA